MKIEIDREKKGVERNNYFSFIRIINVYNLMLNTSERADTFERNTQDMKTTNFNVCYVFMYLYLTREFFFFLLSHRVMLLFIL